MSGALASLGKAEALLSAEKYAAALPPLAAAARAAGNDLFLKAEILWRRAEALRALGRFRDALAAYWASHALYRRAGVPSERLRTLLGASACLRILGRFAQARAMWNGAARMAFFSVQDPPPHEVLLERALVERGFGDLAAARAMLTSCLRRAPRSDAAARRHAWWALGGAERFAGRFAPALEAFGRAARLAGALKDDLSRAYALCGQAGALRVVGRGKESLAKYKEAHRIFVKRKDPFGEAYGLCGMGNALRTYGGTAAVRRSLGLYARSAALYRRVGDDGSRAFAVWGTGGAWLRLGKAARAGRLYAESLRAFRRVGDERGVIMARLGLGRAAKDRRSAAGHFRRALKAAAKARLPYETALARRELGFSTGRPLPASRFAVFGITPAVLKSWKDIP